MRKLILGVDAGNHSAKTVGAFGTDIYKTNICDWFDRKVEETFGKDDMEFEIGGRKGFAGTIAEIEDEFGISSMYGDSKAHDDTKIRVLLAIHRYLKKYCPHFKEISIVVGQPIKQHNPSEKSKIINMLQGYHEFKVNGEKQSFIIENVRVAPEGSGAFWSFDKMGTWRIIDIGSGTLNASTIKDKHHVNNASDTFNFGVETLKNKNDLEIISRGIIRSTTSLKWQKNDDVLIVGGIAEGIYPHIKEHYNNATVLKPVLQRVKPIELHPVYGNAVGYFELAKGAFG